MNLTVIVPTLNDSRTIQKCLWPLSSSDVELFVVDGGSRDDTVEKALECNVRVWHGPPSIAARCNLGAEKATRAFVLFLNPASRFAAGWEEPLQKVLEHSPVVGGSFRLQLDDPRPRARVESFLRNWRARAGRVASPDQALFVRTTTFREIAGLRMDAADPFRRLCQDLETRGEFVLIPHPVVLGFTA